MRRLLLIALICALPAPAVCAYCVQLPCWSAAICGECTCVQPQPHLAGRCVFIAR